VESTRLRSEALGIFDERPRAHYLVGHALVKSGQLEAALAPLQRAAALAPGERAYREALAALRRRLGHAAAREPAAGRALSPRRAAP
jgi:Flp pilus assembly protein TadD